jgi:hypothetical protein
MKLTIATASTSCLGIDNGKNVGVPLLLLLLRSHGSFHVSRVILNIPYTSDKV